MDSAFLNTDNIKAHIFEKLGLDTQVAWHSKTMNISTEVMPLSLYVAQNFAKPLSMFSNSLLSAWPSDSSRVGKHKTLRRLEPYSHSIPGRKRDLSQ